MLTTTTITGIGMKAVQGSDYGNIEEVLTVQDNVPIPSLLTDVLSSSSSSSWKRKNLLLIRTLAVALSAGDCRVLSGLTRPLQGPPSFPYIPGGDCCGIVVQMPLELDRNDALPLPFGVGDRVAARFVGAGPRGALGEYAIVDKTVCDKVPDDHNIIISNEEAAALVSASPAIVIADSIRQGDRVLILGAGGGMGSHVCQLARARGASLIVGVSQTPQRLLNEPIRCDVAVDYTKEEDVFAMEEFQNCPLDVIIDFAGGAWLRLLQTTKQQQGQQQQQKVPSIIKPASQGGRFLAVIPDNHIFEAHTYMDVLNLFVWPALWRAIKTRLWARWKLPAFTFAWGLLNQRQVLTRTFDMVQCGKLTPVIHGGAPFPFTTDGVRKAFLVQNSHHAQGKVVIRVQEK